MTGGREHQGSSCRGVGVVRLEPFDPSSGSGRGLLAESSNAELFNAMFCTITRSVQMLSIKT